MERKSALESELDTPGYPINYYLIIQELKEIKNDLKRVKSSITKMEVQSEQLYRLENDMERVNKNMDYIEVIWNRVKKPLELIVNKIENMNEPIKELDNIPDLEKGT